MITPDPPKAPVHLSGEVAYGWQCGWVAGHAAALVAVGEEARRLRRVKDEARKRDRAASAAYRQDVARNGLSREAAIQRGIANGTDPSWYGR